VGPIGACGDNAAMESFFGLRQKNVLDHRSLAPIWTAGRIRGGLRRTNFATFDPIAGSGGIVLVTGSIFGLVSPKVGPAARDPEGRHDAWSREHSRSRPQGA
jgi:hypothetical protein